MSSSSAEPTSGNATLLISELLWLIDNFMKAEADALKAGLQETVFRPHGASEGQAADVSEFVTILVDQMEIAINSLMARRLVANDRTVVLLDPSDATRVVESVIERLSVDDAKPALRKLLPSMVGAQIISTSNYYRAFNADLYVAFWMHVNAIIATALQTGSTPEQVVADPEARAAVYAAVMTHEAWTELTKLRVKAFADLGSSDLFGVSADPGHAEVAALRAMVVAAAEKFFADRGRAIWPDAA